MRVTDNATPPTAATRPIDKPTERASIGIWEHKTAWMDALQKELSNLNKVARLSSAVEDVDNIIGLLSAARDQVARGEFSGFPAFPPSTVVPALTKWHRSIGSPHSELDDGEASESDQGGLRSGEPGPEGRVQVTQKLGKSFRQGNNPMCVS